MHKSILALNMGQRLFAICILSGTLSFVGMRQATGETPAAIDDLTASVMGRIVNSLTGEPVKGATVEMTCSTRYCQTRIAKCLADGTFTFDGVTPGAYNFAAYAERFVTGADSVAAHVGVTVPASTIVLKLIPGATVRGRVVDHNGTPVASASVQALTEMRTLGVRQLVQRSRTTTDASGTYAMNGLAPGQYYILCRAESTVGGAILAPSYFPNSPTSEQASPVLLESGGVYSDINIYMPAAGRYRIDGAISDVGELGPKPEIRLEPQSYLESKVLGRQAKVGANGQFAITNVTPGHYVLLLRAVLATTEISQQQHTPRILARQDVEVGSTDVNGIILSPTVAVVRGSISSDDGNAQDLQQARVYLRSMRGGSIKLIRPNPDGTFSMDPCDPVEYLAMIVPPPGSYVQSVQFDKNAADTRLLDLAGGGIHQLKIVVKRDGAEVEGVIKTQSNAGNQTGTATSMSAILIPEGWNPDGWADRRLVTVNDSGFDFKDVAPGVYTAIAVQNSSEIMRSAENPDVVGRLQTLGERIEVGPRDKKEISIPVALDQ